MAQRLETLEIAGSPLFIGQDALQKLAVQIDTVLKGKQNIIILTDRNSNSLCLPVLLEQVPQLLKAYPIIIEPGEVYKTIQTCEFIWTQLAGAGANRQSLLINLGGGVITDMGGFAAATFHRGMPFINIPTTLMSMIDAGIGGKTGVNIASLKNMAGLFVNPQAVFVWPGFLKTLPHKYLLSGYAEIMKDALIADADLWKDLIKFHITAINNWDDLLHRSAMIKCKVVNNDPQETGSRRLLNFGHTFGHAFETFSLRHDTSPISHGEAIAMGMICEAYISYCLIGFDLPELEEVIRNILLNFDHYPIESSNIDELFEIIMYDKKNRNGNILITMLKSIGKAVDGLQCEAPLIRECLLNYVDIMRGIIK
ncbi:MAG: 3-dehydroquinate synthase [Lentimicrobiaceae bacterium]